MEDINIVLFKRKQEREKMAKDNERKRREKYEKEQKNSHTENLPIQLTKQEEFYKKVFEKTEEEIQRDKKPQKIDYQNEYKKTIKTETKTFKKSIPNQNDKKIQKKRKFQVTQKGQPKFSYQMKGILDKLSKK